MIRNDSEVEQTVLGAILISPDLLKDTNLTVDHFATPNNKIIFKAILDTAKKNIDIDYITVGATLEQVGKIETIGGFGYLTQLANHIDTFVHFDSHVLIIKQQYAERKSYEIACKLQANEITVDEALEQLNKLNKVQDSNKLPDMKKDLVDYLEYLTTDNNGIETKFTDFDNLTDGLHNGELVILGARPAMGKTAFALNLASNIMKSDLNPNGAVVAFFSLEMSKFQLFNRISSMHTGIDLVKFRKSNKRFTNEDWRRSSMFMAHFSETTFYPFADVSDLKDILRTIRLIRENHKDENIVVIIDHIGLIEGAKGANKNIEIGEITRKLKLLTLELNINIFALSQLSRAVEHRQEKRPSLADLRESGNIEQDADLVMFLYRDDYYNSNEAPTNISELIISKHRNGDVGTINLHFDKQRTKFNNILMSEGGEI